MQEPTGISEDEPLPGMEDYVPAPKEYAGLLGEPANSPIFAEKGEVPEGGGPVEPYWRRNEALQIVTKVAEPGTPIVTILKDAETVLNWLRQR